MSAGARSGVLQAMGLAAPARDRNGPSIARCQRCRSDLEFRTGEFGQTLEACTNRRCPGAVAHHPEPDGIQAPSVAKPPRQKRRGLDHPVHTSNGPAWRTDLNDIHRALDEAES